MLDQIYRHAGGTCIYIYMKNIHFWQHSKNGTEFGLENKNYNCVFYTFNVQSLYMSELCSLNTIKYNIQYLLYDLGTCAFYNA